MTATKRKVWEGPDQLRRLLVPIDSLEPWPDNPRRGDVDAVAGSLRRFGQVKAIVVTGSRITAGHHVVLAAIELGWTHVAAMDGQFADEEEARAFLVADNRTSELGTVDKVALAAQLNAIREASTLDGTGYLPIDLAALERDLELLRRGGRQADRDAAPDPPTVAKSEPGQVYELGEHRLMCGSAVADLPHLMGGVLADVLWTDPPYGVNYVGKTKNALTIEGDSPEGLRAFLAAAFMECNGVMDAGCRFYVASPAGPRHLDFLLAIEETEWTVHETLVWVKDAFVLGHSDYHYRHEPIVYGWKRGPGRVGRGNHDGTRWYGDHAQDSVFNVPRPKRSEEHPTMKPVELITRQLANSSVGDAAVLDPFAGSGSTMIACEELGRRCFAMEIDPVYCDVIRQRYADFTENPQLAP